MTGHPKKNVEDPCHELKWKYEKDVKRSGRQICREAVTDVCFNVTLLVYCMTA